ncbi:hypothetical protein OK016_19040 [Vibrio chagasii]|nr:hypothetical protein [Vibrio chagasii]
MKEDTGFIYPYHKMAIDSSRIALFDNKAWWLDDQLMMVMLYEKQQV